MDSPKTDDVNILLRAFLILILAMSLGANSQAAFPIAQDAADRPADPPDPFYLARLNDGEYLYQNADYEGALDNFKIAAFGLLSHPPLLLKSHVYLVLCHLKMKSREEAEQAYSRIERLGLDRYFADVEAPPRTLVEYLKAASDFSGDEPSPRRPVNPAEKKALESEAKQLKREIKNNPSSVDQALQLSYLYQRLGKADEAKKALVNLLQNNPDSGPARFELGKIYFEEKDMNNALLQFDIASARLGNDPERLYELARIYFDLDRLDRAKQLFLRVRSIRSDFRDTGNYLVLIEKLERSITPEAAFEELSPFFS